jgi:glucosylceramidase
MKMAKTVTPHDELKFMASPWGPPAWLKTNGKIEGAGTLIGEAGDKYHKTYANYFVKLVTNYAKLFFLKYLHM